MAYIADGKTLAPKGALVITEYDRERRQKQKKQLNLMKK